jgi:hypothetical protein
MFKGESCGLVKAMPNYCPPVVDLNEQEWLDRALFSANSQKVVFVETDSGRWLGVKVNSTHLYGTYPETSPVWSPNTVVWQDTDLTFDEVKHLWTSK